jgi:hypothetical protein
MSLLDFFSGYHQVWMKKEDEDKMSFTTPFGVFCFMTMPEGLHDPGPTFNIMVKIMLGPRLRRNVSVYVDGIVIHNKNNEDHIEDLRETFANLRKYVLMLNPEKFIFGVSKGKLLGCRVSKSGIQANPKKIEAIRNMRTPRNPETYQKNSSTWPLHITVGRKKPTILQIDIREEQDCLGAEEEKAFKRFKAYLENLAILKSPEDKAKLLLYIAASASAVSAALVEEKYEEGNLKQILIYFVSKALTRAKKFYLELEKMTYAMVMATRKLKHYFQSYSITIATSYPLREILENKESSARIGKWAIKLS